MANTTTPFQLMFEQAPDAIFLEDLEGTVLEVNQAACDLHGMEREAMIGRNVAELVPPEYREQVAASFQAWTEAGRQRLESFSYTADGRAIPVEIHGCPIDHEGQNLLLFTVRDISKRRAMELALQESEERFRRMVKHAPRAIVLFDMASGRFIEVNEKAEELYALPREALLKLGPIDLSPEFQPNGEASGIFATKLINRAAAGENIQFEWVHCNSLGEPIPCEICLLKLEMQGRVLIRASMEDLRPVKEAQRIESELLRQRQRAKRSEMIGLLAGGVAHDLNNILGPLVGYPDLLLDEFPMGSENRESILSIKHSAERASAIIQDLLVLSRKRKVDSTQLSLNMLVEEYLDSAEFRTALNAQGTHVLHREFTLGIPEVEGSPPHLLRLVMNLCINALQAMPQGGALSVGTYEEAFPEAFNGFDTIPAGHYCVLVVRDNGIGIAEDQLESIFEPFVSHQAKSAQHGSGIGLAVVYGVMRDHGGYIDIRSRPGNGTEFRMYFPASASGARTVRIRETISTGKGRILVIDDLIDQRDLARQLLERVGYEVVTAEHGHAGLDCLLRQSFDLVILDMIMEEGFDGLDTYRQIHTLYPELPCIIASGFAESHRVREALTLGAGPYIQKPYSLARLSYEVKKALSDKCPAGN